MDNVHEVCQKRVYQCYKYSITVSDLTLMEWLVTKVELKVSGRVHNLAMFHFLDPR
jgi:hypothetical protein